MPQEPVSPRPPELAAYDDEVDADVTASANPRLADAFADYTPQTKIR